ncbi:glycosyltransferase family 4 protein [Sodalinema gerasimenkoae]|uniref:glycosyltransferase family 4 protein n=1 Tax=Sodalinema gerasimenkoae TaxID=2862348 RepID=UPI00135A516D|nr:glycosyltransferase family 1 protein [Sodalinema gerasimenkoae]
MGKIAFDASSFHWSRSDGLNRYVGELLNDYRDGDRFCFYTSDSSLVRADSPQFQILPHSTLYRNDFKNNLRRLVWHQIGLPFSILKQKQRLFYSPVFEGMLVPVCPQIITIHDILPIRFPDVYPRIKYYFKFILPQLIRASDAIITTSNYTKKEILDHYNCHNTPIHVVYQGYREDIFNLNSDDLENPLHRSETPFILCVGETRPYKNLRRLIEAFSRANCPNLELRIVGNLNKCDRPLLDYPQELGCHERVKFLGFVPDDALPDLYRRAIAFAFPSLYEGFGIPPLEAMACGCPVLASNQTAIPEVCGEAAFYVNPYDIDDIAQGIVQLVNNPQLRQQLRQRGQQQVQSFRYRQMGDRILDILDHYLTPNRANGTD